MKPPDVEVELPKSTGQGEWRDPEEAGGGVWSTLGGEFPESLPNVQESLARLRDVAETVEGGLENSARLVLRHIHGDPGCMLSELRKQLHLPKQALHEAVDRLQCLGLVDVHASGPALHHFPVIPGLAEGVQQYLALRKPDVWELVQWHLEQGPCTRTKLFEFAEEELGWTETITRRRLAALLACGLVRQSDPPVGYDQRCKWLEARPPRKQARFLLAIVGRH